MNEPKNPPSRDRDTERAARLAASLRENLKRRKAQKRGRTENSEPGTGANPASAAGRNHNQPAD